MRKVIIGLVVLSIFMQGCLKNQEEQKKDSINCKLNGVVQKGPFIEGTNVIIQELNEKMNQTGKMYQTETTNDFGSFIINTELSSKYIEITTDGYYFNEITGKLSTSKLSLKSLVEASEVSSTNVNILTTLSRERIKKLINDGKSFTEAKRQAEEEVLTNFNIMIKDIKENIAFEKLDITKNGDLNAILLAISCILQYNKSEAELSESITKIANDIAQDGVLNSELYKLQINNNSRQIDSSLVKNNLKNRYELIGEKITIPVFELYLDDDGDGIINKYDFKLLTPSSSGIIDVIKPKFSWERSGMINARYHFQISKTSDFINIVEEGDNLTELDYTLKKPLQNYQTYYWRVLIKDEKNNERSWSNYEYIYVILRSVYLLGPYNNVEVDNTTPVFEWQDRGESGWKYLFQLADDIEFKNIIDERDNLSVTTYQIKKTLTTNKNYYWRVLLKDAENNNYSWSASNVFKIKLKAGILNKPAEKAYINSSTQIFEWERVIYGNKFKIIISKNSDLSNPVIETVLETNIYKTDKDALEDGKYYWSVVAIDKNEVCGEYSNINSFSVDKKSPSIISVVPTQNATVEYRNAKVEIKLSEEIINFSADKVVLLKGEEIVTNCSINYDKANNTITVAKDYLVPAKTYKIIIKGTISDSAGNLMGSDFNSSFKTSDTDMSKDLLLYYQCNGNLNDASGKGNSAIGNNVEYSNDRNNLTNSSIKMSLNSSIEIPRMTELDKTSWSYSVWVKFDKLPSEGTSAFLLVGKSSGPTFDGGNDVYLYVAKEDDTIKIFLENIQLGSASCEKVSTNYKISINTWYNIILIAENNRKVLYVNNDKIIDVNKSFSSIFPVGEPYIIGKNNIKGDLWGNIDDIRLFSRVINEGEVSALYESKD